MGIEWEYFVGIGKVFWTFFYCQAQPKPQFSWAQFSWAQFSFIAKLSQSSNLSKAWAVLALISITPATHPNNQPINPATHIKP